MVNVQYLIEDVSHSREFCFLKTRLLLSPFQDGSRTSTWVPDGKSFVEFMHEDARTTHDCFKRGLRISSKCGVSH